MWSWKHRTDNLTNWAGAVRGVASLRNWYLGWDVKDGGWIKVRGEQRVVCACTFWVQEDYNHRPSARRNTGQVGSTQKTARGAKAKAKQRARETGMRGGQRISEHHRHGPSRPTSRHLVVLGGASEQHGTPYSARSSHEPQPTATPRFEALRGRTTWPPDGTPFCHYGAPKNPSAVIPESRLLHENATCKNSNREERDYSDRSHCRKII